jgi:hypothetical protein
VDTLIRQNHQSVKAFCIEHNVVPKPRSFFYCPHDVVKFVYESLTSAGVDDSTAGRILGSQLWLSNDDYDAKDCGGAAICVHGRQKYFCAECEGSGICVHGSQKYFCAECEGSGICVHGRQKCGTLEQSPLLLEEELNRQGEYKSPKREDKYVKKKRDNMDKA